MGEPVSGRFVETTSFSNRFDVRTMWWVLEVAPSGYYAWLQVPLRIPPKVTKGRSFPQMSISRSPISRRIPETIGSRRHCGCSRRRSAGRGYRAARRLRRVTNKRVQGRQSGGPLNWIPSGRRDADGRHHAYPRCHSTSGESADSVSGSVFGPFPRIPLRQSAPRVDQGLF